ncbi:MAG: response regulator [Deltaproteobacteria bacterium]|nr:response regulator [Deltaproteobacteria bacterium]
MTVKILTVDDSKTIRMIVKKAFKPFDCKLSEAENGVEGLAAAAKEKPDLIVLDITMPVMNGIEMLEKLKGEPDLQDIPVIMLTAESGKDNVMQIVKMGVKDYMVKPFKGEQLIERAEKVVQLEAKKAEEIAADASKQYFSLEDDVQVMTMPGKINRKVNTQIQGFLKTKLQDIVKSGINKLILNLSEAEETNMSLIKVIVQVLQACQKASLNIQIVGTKALSEGLKGFAETSEIKIAFSVDEAKAAF